MNNEPVAWMSNGKEFYVQKNYCPDFIPLYTHPTKTQDEGKVCARCGAIAYDPVITQTAKTLTDEEIVSLYKETEADNGGIREFARAILKKASEK